MANSAEPKTIVYKTVGKLEIPLDIYLPANAKNVPILLWFHGGGLLHGHRETVAPHHRAAVEKYKIAVVSADYRFAPQIGVADVYEDIKDCISFIRTELSSHVEKGALDPSRLAVSGSSAGGYLALLAGLYVEPKPNVIMPVYAITDPLGSFFTTSHVHPAAGGRIDPATMAEYYDPKAAVVANNPAKSQRNFMYFYMMQEANLASLLHITPEDQAHWQVSKQIASRGLPPMYIAHGDADVAVGVEQADEVVGAAIGLGDGEVVYERLRGKDHLFDYKPEVEMEKMYAFMLAHL